MSKNWQMLQKQIKAKQPFQELLDTLMRSSEATLALLRQVSGVAGIRRGDGSYRTAVSLGGFTCMLPAVKSRAESNLGTNDGYRAARTLLDALLHKGIRTGFASARALP